MLTEGMDDMGQKKTTTKPRPALYFRVPQPLHNSLSLLAKREGVTVSEAARMALREFFRSKAA